MCYGTIHLFTAPSGPPFNIQAYILNETSINVNWTVSSGVNGYVIVFIDSTGNRNAISTTETEIVISNLPLNTFNISVYSYEDILSVNSEQTLLVIKCPSTCKLVY